MGVRRSKKIFFKDLVGDTMDIDGEESEGELQSQLEVNCSDSESDDVELDGPDIHPHPLCISQEIRGPLVNLPSQMFRPSAENDLMPVDTDEELFDMELNEEIEVNKADEVAQRKFEDQLWGYLS